MILKLVTVALVMVTCGALPSRTAMQQAFGGDGSAEFVFTLMR